VQYRLSYAEAQAALRGWPEELLREVANARTREDARALIEGSRSAIDDLPAYAHALLVERLEEAVLAIRECNGCCGDV
jgi:hypothetical protein